MREGSGTLFDLLPVLGVLYLGPRIDRFHLPLLLYMPWMPCYYSVVFGRLLFCTVYFAGRFMRGGHPQSHFRGSDYTPAAVANLLVRLRSSALTS